MFAACCGALVAIITVMDAGSTDARRGFMKEFEAIIAAIYLDGGITAAERFLERCFRPQLDAVRTGGLTSGLTEDHKSALQEFLQSHDMGLPDYRLIGETGPAHRKVFETEVYAEDRPLARGEGRSKKEAEQQAAERARKELGTEP